MYGYFFTVPLYHDIFVILYGVASGVNLLVDGFYFNGRFFISVFTVAHAQQFIQRIAKYLNNGRVGERVLARQINLVIPILNTFHNCAVSFLAGCQRFLGAALLGNVTDNAATANRFALRILDEGNGGVDMPSGAILGNYLPSLAIIGRTSNVNGMESVVNDFSHLLIHQRRVITTNQILFRPAKYIL